MNATQESLITDNIAIVGRVVRRVMRACPSYIDVSDLKSVGQLALVKAAVASNGESNFAACAYQAVRGAVLDERRRMMRSNRDRGEMPAEVDRQGEHRPEGDLYASVSALPPREYRAIVLIFWGGRSQSEVAAELGVTQQTVSRILGSAKKHLRECVNRNYQTNT